MKPATCAWAMLLISLTACVDPQREQEELQQQQQVLVNDYCRDRFSVPGLEPIRSKVAIVWGGDSMPLQMLSNNEYPNKEEKQAILLWAEQRQQCYEYQSSVWGPPPAHMQAMRSAVNQFMANLYGGTITYGQFAKQRSQNSSAFKQEDAALRLQAARDQLQVTQAFQQNRNQQQQLRQQRDIEQQRLQNEQLRALQRQPNPQINCTTQYIGNQAYTNCQ